MIDPMKAPTLIASYPRSGSTYLRFLLANVLWPDVQHDFDSVNKHIPTIESKRELLNCIKNPPFFKTHEMRHCRNVVFLYRHVGDCLVSEYHYHLTYHNYDRSIGDFIDSVGYGQKWREMVDHYWPGECICFEDMIKDPMRILRSICHVEDSVLEKAIELCKFESLRDLDKMFFRSGKVGQWKDLNDDISAMIIERNWNYLKILGYKI